jgi:hypothetical protein
VCDPSQKISRIERDTNVIYTHTRMELCAQYCVREAFYIFFYLWACCCFVICFPSFSFPRSTSRRLLFSFILQSYRSIRSGLDTSNRRGVSRIFSLSYPLIKRRKHKERRRKIEKRGSEWDIDPHSSPYNTRETIVGWVPWFSDSSSSRRNLNSFSLYAIDRNRYSSHSPFSSAPRRRRRRMKKRQKACWAVVEMAESSSISPLYYKEPGNLRGARKKNAFPPY